MPVGNRYACAIENRNSGIHVSYHRWLSTLSNPHTQTSRGLLRQTQYFLIALATVPLLLSLLVFYTSNEHRKRIAETLATSRFIVALDDFMSTMQDAETGQRGYLLTGSPAYLTPYTSARDAMPSRLANLIALGTNAGLPESTWAPLRTAESAKMSELEDTIHMHDTQGAAAAIAEVRTNRGQRAMEQIRSVLGRIKHQETDTYHLRFFQTQRSERNLRIALAFAVVIAVALLFAAFHLSQAYALRRDLDEAEFRRLNEELEARVRERTAELEARTRESEAHALDLERSNSDLMQFASIASHDLQEPLRMIASYMGMLSLRYGSSLDDTAKTYIDFAVKGARRMQTLVSDLLTYSRAGTQALNKEPISFDRIVQRATENLHLAIQESAARINHTQLPVVDIDTVKMVQVMQNLLGNAIKFRRSDVPLQIDITANRQNSLWLFSVKDNGIGFDPKYADRIFLVFQRLHGGGKYPGNGIGLSICRRIVEHHGGRLWAESEPGAGSTFWFTLPSIRSADKEVRP